MFISHWKFWFFTKNFDFRQSGQNILTKMFSIFGPKSLFLIKIWIILIIGDIYICLSVQIKSDNAVKITMRPYELDDQGYIELVDTYICKDYGFASVMRWLMTWHASKPSATDKVFFSLFYETFFPEKLHIFSIIFFWIFLKNIFSQRKKIILVSKNSIFHQNVPASKITSSHKAFIFCSKFVKNAIFPQKLNKCFSSEFMVSRKWHFSL